MIKYPLHCPYCNAKIVMPIGLQKSKLLILGIHPGWEEIRDSKAWIGNASDVLRAELALLGVDLAAIRASNLWLHAPNDSPDCKEWCFEMAIREFENKRVAFLVGAETCKFFTEYSITEITGLALTKEQVKFVSGPDWYVFGVNPAQAIALENGLGEVKFSIKTFVDLAWEYLE